MIMFAWVKRKENRMKINRFTLLRHTLASLIVVSMLLGAFPRPALAATCKSYYNVKSGDTKTSIAKKFGLDWSDIADANDMKVTEKPQVGDRLCIPYKNDKDQANPNMKLKVAVTHTVVTLTITGMSDKRSVFIVRVRDARVGVGGFYKLGRMKAKKSSTNKATFAIPKGLSKTLYLQVCVKNSTTDEMICRTVLHP
jgi:LysM repeat protein